MSTKQQDCAMDAPLSEGCVRNRGAASSRRRNSAMSLVDISRMNWSKGGTISRILDCHNRYATGKRGNGVFVPCEERGNGALRRNSAELARKSFARPASHSAACPFCCARLTRTITKLRFPRRKTRPSVKTVITLGLRKNAPDENRCREGDAYSAQIRQSRCHCAGISFV